MPEDYRRGQMGTGGVARAKGVCPSQLRETANPMTEAPVAAVSDVVGCLLGYRGLSLLCARVTRSQGAVGPPRLALHSLSLSLPL